MHSGASFGNHKNYRWFRVVIVQSDCLLVCTVSFSRESIDNAEIKSTQPTRKSPCNLCKSIIKTPNVYRRYLEKIKLIGYYDPYNPSFFGHGSDNQIIPTTVTIDHVIDYLMNMFRHMKNSRSLEGYKKFESGFVHWIQKTIREGQYDLVGKV